MKNVLLSLVTDQLKLATDFIRTAVESNSSTVSREHLTLGLERMVLVQELLSTFSQELSRIESQNNEYRQKINFALIPPVRMREPQQEPQKGSASPLRTERSIFPDQGLIDSYNDLAIKYGNIRREMALMRANIESALRHLNDFWVGDEETKHVIVEQLRLAITTKESS